MTAAIGDCSTSCCSDGSHCSSAECCNGSNNNRTVRFAPPSANCYYKRKGSWLNKAELYFSKSALKEMRAEATALAKAIEAEGLCNPQALRGYEGLAPKAFAVKSQRRKRARDAVLEAATAIDADGLAARYAEVVEEAVLSALQVAEGDAKEVQRMSQDDSKQEVEESKCRSDGDSSIPTTTLTAASILQAAALVATQKTPLRAQNSSFHTDVTSVYSDDSMAKAPAAVPSPTPKRGSFQKVMKFGKRLLRKSSPSSSSSITSAPTLDASWKQ